jgi:hypothetical protein
MAAKVFISYRRGDIAGAAGRVSDRLAQEFGRDSLFMDVDSIPLGINFVKALDDEVAKCDVLLAIIGRDWLDARDKDGQRRVDNQHDYVRIEVAAALRRDIPVIPILVDGAQVPKADQLPDNLKDLALRNGLDVRHASFHPDMDKLIRFLKERASRKAQTEVARQAREEEERKQEEEANLQKRVEEEQCRQREAEATRRTEEEALRKEHETEAQRLAEERRRAEAKRRAEKEQRRAETREAGWAARWLLQKGREAATQPPAWQFVLACSFAGGLPTMFFFLTARWPVIFGLSISSMICGAIAAYTRQHLGILHATWITICTTTICTITYLTINGWFSADFFSYAYPFVMLTIGLPTGSIFFTLLFFEWLARRRLKTPAG